LGSIVIDASQRPIFLVTYTGTVTNARFNAYLKQMDDTLEDLSPRVVIFNAIASGRTPAYQRKRQAQWIRERMPQLKQGTIANIFVLASPIVRMVLTSILWIQRLPWPYYVVPNLEQALEKAYELFEEQEIPYTPYVPPKQSTG